MARKLQNINNNVAEFIPSTVAVLKGVLNDLVMSGYLCLFAYMFHCCYLLGFLSFTGTESILTIFFIIVIYLILLTGGLLITWAC